MTEQATPAARGWSAFVLSPIGGEFDEVYEQLIRPALEQAGFEVRRADELDLQNIMSAVIHGISSADLIIAEITALNPNVMYELGIAHALNKPVVMLTQDIAQVPFDLRSYRVITYSARFSAVGKLIDTLQALATALVAGSLTFSSPVADFRGSPDPSVSWDAPTTPADGDDDDPGPGLFDHFESNAALFDALGVGTEAFGGAIEAVGAKIAERTAELGESDPNRAGHTARVLSTLRRSAQDVNEFTQSAREYDALLDEVVPQLAETILGISDLASIEGEENRASAHSYLQMLSGLAETMSESSEGLNGFRESIREVRDLKLSRDFSKAASQAVRVMDSVAGKLASFESDLIRGTALLTERLGTA